MIRLSRLLFVAAAMSLMGGTLAHSAELTKADIPPNLPPDLTQLIKRTFSSRGDRSAYLAERAVAAREIGEIHERAAAAVPFLIRLLGEDYDSVQDAATDALVAIGNPAVEPCILTAMAEASPGELTGGMYPLARRYSAISCLGRFKSKYPRALDALLALLKDTDPEFRRSAAAALRGCTDTRATLPLVKALDDSYAYVRRSAAECFVTLRDPRAVEPLLKLAESGNIWEDLFGDALGARRAAIEALGYQQDRGALPALQRIVRDPRKNKYERGDAAMALGRIGDPAAFPILGEIFWGYNLPVEVRSGAVHAIAMFRDDDTASHMLASLYRREDTPFELRIDIVQAMAEYGDPRAVGLLLYVVDMHGRNKLAFWAAMSAVKLADGAIGDMAVVRVLQEYEEDFAGIALYVKEKQDALQKIAERGTNLRVRLAAKGLDWLLIAVPAAVGVAAVVVAAVWLVVRRCRRPTGVSESV